MNKKVQDLLGEVIIIGGKHKRCNVVALLTNVNTGKQRAIPGANIVTDDGDQYYAEKGVGGSPTKNFAAGGFRLGTDNTPPTKADTDVTAEEAAGRKVHDGTYPQTDDQDSDNTGAGADVATWRVSYGTAEANIADIFELAIVDNITTPTAALTHAVFGAAFTKTVNDTLKIFVNHTFSGV